MGSGKEDKIGIAIIGAGRGCSALLPLLYEDSKTTVVGVADHRQNAPGLALAQEYGIHTTGDFTEFLNNDEIDVIVDVTGNPRVAAALREESHPKQEIIGGLSARLIWLVIEERTGMARDLKEIYRIGLSLAAAQDSERIFKIIVESALRLTKAPAGSIALWDKSCQEFKLGAAIGFSDQFEQNWKLRSGGLTSLIINQDLPIAVESIELEPAFDNPLLISEGVKAVLAMALKVSGDVVGILYVDDFKPRHFTSREISLFTLLANKAALAIQKAGLLEETIQLARTDGLTSLYNHRYFLELLDYEVERANRYGGHFSVIMMDMDNFKIVNDSVGHSAGDRALKRAAAVIKESARASDILARYGGDEFAAILPNTRLDQALCVAERIRSSITKIRLIEMDSTFELSASIGLAEFPACGRSRDKILSAADSALLSCKKKGRNVVGVFKNGDRSLCQASS